MMKKKHFITYIRCRISTCIYINIKLKKNKKKERNMYIDVMKFILYLLFIK